MTGLELLKNPATTAEEIADIISAACPPIGPVACDKHSCRECWLAWLLTGEPPKSKEPPAERTAPCDDGIHPNLAEYLRNEKRLHRELSLAHEQSSRELRHQLGNAH